MTLYTTFEPVPPAERLEAPVREALSVVDGLDAASADVLAALFDADGATLEALVARTSAGDVDGALGTLKRLGYVERDGGSAWLTGEAFGLRRAVRRAGARVPVRFQRRA